MHPCAPSDVLMCSLTDVYLSADPWHFIDNICLLLHREGIFDLSEERMEGGSGLEHHPDVQVLTYPPDLLIYFYNLPPSNQQIISI